MKDQIDILLCNILGNKNRVLSKISNLNDHKEKVEDIPYEEEMRKCVLLSSYYYEMDHPYRQMDNQYSTQLCLGLSSCLLRS
jgi:hypothetical protein